MRRIITIAILAATAVGIALYSALPAIADAARPMTHLWG